MASDPFGFGWDLFGTADWTLNPDPPGHVGLPLLQVLLLLAGHVAGAWVLSRRAELLSERRPGTIGWGSSRPRPRRGHGDVRRLRMRSPWGRGLLLRPGYPPGRLISR